jgi:hypothetical protein
MGIYLKLYPLIIGLQLFFLYHAFKNKADQKWFYLIFFFPAIGALMYLYHHFYSKENISSITEGVKGAINTNYETKKLESELDFSDTIQNKTNLADKYYGLKRYGEAQQLYESCRETFNKNNPDILQKLVRIYFAQKDYNKVIEYSKIIKNKAEFIDSHENIMLAWAFFNEDKIEEAKDEFKKMDGLFCNYNNRLEYAKFLNKADKKEAAVDKVEQLLGEINQMNSQEKRGKRDVYKAIKQFHTEL